MTDFDTTSLPTSVTSLQKACAIVVLAKFALDEAELDLFVQMLGLVDA